MSAYIYIYIYIHSIAVLTIILHGIQKLAPHPFQKHLKFFEVLHAGDSSRSHRKM